jgi:hypothetical protein
LADRSKPKPEAPGKDDGSEILQFKIWLKGISPMIWRRVQVATGTTLRELHGVFQIVMGWEGIHLFQFGLRAAEFGSWELGCRSPDIALGHLRLRKGARFIYEYDLNIPWEHEIRFENTKDGQILEEGNNLAGKPLRQDAVELPLFHANVRGLHRSSATESPHRRSLNDSAKEHPCGFRCVCSASASPMPSLHHWADH